MSKISITVAYFAILQEQAKQKEEILETTPSSAEELYKNLKEKYQFTLPFESIRVANKENFLLNDYQIQDGDYIALIPPVAGG